MRLLTPHRPSPVTSARGLPGGLRVLGRALSASGLLRGGDSLAPHRAWPCILAPVTTRGSPGARPRISRPTVRLPASNPTVARLFPFLFPLFVVVANLGFLSSLFLPFFFFFSFAAVGVGGRGVAWRALKKTSWCSSYSSARLEQLGMSLRCRRTGRSSLLAVPGQGSLCPWSPGPVRRPGTSLPSSSGSVTAPGCWLSSGSPLALMQRPPTSPRPATNQRLAVPL